MTDLKLCSLHDSPQISSEVTIKRASMLGMRCTPMTRFWILPWLFEGNNSSGCSYKNLNHKQPFSVGAGLQVAILAMEDMLAWMEEGGQVWHFMTPPRFINPTNSVIPRTRPRNCRISVNA